MRTPRRCETGSWRPWGTGSAPCCAAEQERYRLEAVSVWLVSPFFLRSALRHKERVMTKHTAAFTSTIVLALGIAALTGSALAGNGTGPASQDHGNSANAPGQVKKTSTASTQSSANSMGGADANADA